MVLLFNIDSSPFATVFLSSSELTRFVRSRIDPSFRIPFPLKIKSKIHDEVCQASLGVSRQFPTTTSHSFQGSSSHVYTLDPPSKFWIIRFTPSSLSFSIFLRPISGTSLRPFQSSSTIGPRRKTFIFSRGQTYISFRFHAFQHALHFRRNSYHTDLNLKSSS